MSRMQGSEGHDASEATAGAEAAFASYIVRVQRGESVDFDESIYNTALEEFLETLALVEAHNVDSPPWSEPSRTLN